VTDSDAESFLTVSPSGSPTPTASNLNFAAGQIIPNLVTVKVGLGGKVDIATAMGSTNVVADLVGWYDGGTATGDRFTPITPRRALDSRTSLGGWPGKLTAGTPRNLVVRGASSGVPDNATAVVANITVTGGTDASFVTAWPAGSAQPNASNLNLSPGQTIPNLATVKVGAGGAIRFANAVGAVHVVVDIVGYYQPTTGGLFHALAPNRVLDTRSGKGLAGMQGPGQSRDLAVAGAAGTGIPADATAVVANVTVADATAESFVSVYPAGVTRPNPFSNLNFGRNQVIPNLTVVGIGTGGSVALYNHLGSTHLVADVNGWFAPPPT
jgi:hypothetical protein